MTAKRKGALVALGVLVCVAVSPIAAQENEDTVGLAFDGGVGISFGLLSDPSDDVEAALTGFATFLATLRGALYGNVRYEITKQLSAGAQLGVYAITYSSGDSSATLVDFPIKAIARFGLGSFAVEGFGGYYLSVLSSPDYTFGGLEVGAKVFLGGLYGSFAQVFATDPYRRIEIGFQVTDAFKP